MNKKVKYIYRKMGIEGEMKITKNKKKANRQKIMKKKIRSFIMEAINLIEDIKFFWGKKWIWRDY